MPDRTTLARFLVAQRGRRPGGSGELDALILDIAQECATVSRRLAHGDLGRVPEAERGTDVPGGTGPRLDVVATPRGSYLLTFDPPAGSSTGDVSAGSVFSILRAPEGFLQPGSAQVCAGYAVYGAATVLVLSVGTGVHAFTLDPGPGEFVRTRRDLRIPRATGELAIDAANRRFWEPPVRRYVDECLAGRDGPRGKDYSLRWAASLVAGLHRVLTRGGVFLDPQDARVPRRDGRPRLLSEAAPVAFLVEQAGGRAGTGRRRLLDVVATGPHQRVPLVFGAAEEVGRIEALHAAEHSPARDAPLFGTRGLFRVPG